MEDERGSYRRAALVIAGLATCLAISLSVALIMRHLRHWTQPLVQRKIVGILWMVPIYAATSFQSLLFRHAAVYLDMVRDCYEAYAVWLFLALMVAYLGNGDDYRIIEIIDDLEPLPHPYPLSRLWRPIAMDSSFLRRCKRGTLQFVVVKPATTVLAAFLELHGLYDKGNLRLSRGYVYVVLIQNVSVTYAFYSLVLFYVALREHLRPFDPVPKFVSVKAVLFLSFWQGVLIAALVKLNVIHGMGTWTVENVATGTQNFLLCIEMLLAAVVHYHAFPVDPFLVKGQSPGDRLLPLNNVRLRDQFAVDDTISDLNDVMPGRIVLPSSFRPRQPTITQHASGRTGMGGRGAAMDAEASHGVLLGGATSLGDLVVEPSRRFSEESSTSSSSSSPPPPQPPPSSAPDDEDGGE